MEIKLIESDKLQSGKNQKKNADNLQAVGWTGLGLVALCGICCSAPLLAGVMLAGGSIIAFLATIAWPLAILVGLSLLIGLFFWVRRPKTTCQNLAGSCGADGACGCKK